MADILASVSVVLGADISAFRAGMAAARRELKGIVQAGEAMKDLGGMLTQYVTLPLAALGAGAIAASGKIESLRNALNAISTQDLAKEGTAGLAAVAESAVLTSQRMKELEVLARQPGLGFEQAVQGDVRLRAVGISAEQSAKSLKAFANAIATTGGGKSEFDRVTTQLAQMSAKGKVLAQDLRPIIEAAPAVSAALQKLYGTVDSEDISKQLQKQGKSSTDFIAVLTEELGKIPTVAGGLKNSLENLGDTVTISLAKIGDGISSALNLPALLAGISDFVARAGDAFAGLSPGAQKLVVVLGGVVAATGPVLVALGTLGVAAPAIVSGFNLLTSGSLALSGALSGTLRAALAALLTPTGAIVAVLATLAVVVYAAATASERAYDSFVEQSAVTKQLTTDMSPLLDRYDELKGKTELSVAEQAEMKAIIEKVTGVLPDVGKGMDQYGNYIDIVTSKARAYIAENQRLDKAIALQSLPGQLEKLAELQQAYDSLARIREEIASNGTFNGVSIGDLGPKALLEFRENVSLATKALEAQQQRVASLQGTINGLGTAYEDASLAGALFGEQFGSITAGLREEGGLLERLRAQLKAVREQRETEVKVSAIAADNKLIKSLEAQIAALEGIDKKGRKAQDAVAKLRAELAALTQLDNVVARPADDIDTVTRRIKTLEGGLKTLLEAGVSPNSKAFKEFAHEALTLNQGLAKLQADTQQPFKVVGQVKLINTLGDAIAGLRGTELENHPILIPLRLAPMKTDFAQDLANVGIALNKVFSQNAASSITFGRGFNQAAADADALKSKLQELISQGVDPLDPAFKRLANAYATTQRQAEAYSSTLAASQQASQALQQGIIGLAGGIADAFGAALMGTQSLGDALTQALLSTIGSVAGQLGSILLASGIGIEALKVSLATFTGVGAIAAGLGLLAISGIAKAGMSSLSSGGSAATASTNYASRANLGQSTTQRIQVEVIGTLKAAGADLQAVLRTRDYRQLRTS